MEESIMKEIEKMNPILQNWRRELHKIAECGLFLPETRDFVIKNLQKLGINYQTFKNHSGVVAILGNGNGKTIGLRADMDALLIEEETHVEYTSIHKGCMHACGHDAHTSILLGVASILKKYESDIQGYVKLIFQPAEETPPGGAKLMIEDGVLENPKVDAILGIHMNRLVEGTKKGDFVIKAGSIMGADDVIKLKIIGKGGHASEPQNIIDPILVAANCIVSLQQIISRNINPNDASVISITDFHAGTGTDNVIPEQVNIIGTIRNSDEKTRQTVLKRFKEVIGGITKAMGAEYELELIPDYPVLSNEGQLTEMVKDSVKELYGTDSIVEQSFCSMGGDDFAFFSQRVPGCYFTLVADKAAEDGIIYPAHHSKFDIEDNLLDKGVAVFIKTLFKYLNNK